MRHSSASPGDDTMCGFDPLEELFLFDQVMNNGSWFEGEKDDAVTEDD